VRYFFRFIGQIFAFVLKYKGILPLSFTGLFVVASFISDTIRQGVVFAAVNLSKTFFASELVINENVKLAILDSPLYNIGAFFHIIISLFIIWYFIFFVTKLFVKIAGAQAEWGAAVMAVLFFCAIEFASIKIIDGFFGFIPIRDGVFFLLQHIDPVIMNIF
jgi:hypothetical protein